MKIVNLIRLSLLIFVLAFSIRLSAQTNHMNPFNALIGNWTVENYKLNNDKNWEFLGETTSKISIVVDGKFVNEKVKYITDFGEINMITYIGYDSRNQSYKLSAMDAEFGIMDIYLGELRDNEIVFTNLDSDMPFKMDNGKLLWFRVTYKDISEGVFTHLVEGTTDRGKTWFVFSKAKYNKTH